MLSRFFVAGALTAALILAACGGGDSAEPAAEVNASADPASARIDQQAPTEQQAGKSRPSGNKAGSGSRKPGSGGDQGDPLTDAASTTGAEPSAPVVSSGASRPGQSAGNNEPRPTAKTKSKPKQTGPVIPPQFAGMSIYQIAREMCGDTRILEYISEEQRENPEQLAETARSFAPPGKEQEAFDGCLAGLHDIGL